MIKYIKKRTRKIAFLALGNPKKSNLLSPASFFFKVSVENSPRSTTLSFCHGTGLHAAVDFRRVFPKAFVCRNKTLFTLTIIFQVSSALTYPQP